MILASQSPRRIELMREAGYRVSVEPADIDETPQPGEHPLALVERLARAKAAAVAMHAAADEPVIAADTIVTIGGDILGKPHDAADAHRMLRLLSGRTHQVATGVCIACGGKPNDPAVESFVTVTDVSFYPLSDEEIDRYVATGEPMDKAGAYGIQGAGGRMLVRGIRGDYYNVVGLPIAELSRHLSSHLTHM